MTETGPITPASVAGGVSNHHAQKREEAQAAIERVKTLHRSVLFSERHTMLVCEHDLDTWPCATMRAIEGA